MLVEAASTGVVSEFRSAEGLMEARAKLLGHPIHQMLVGLPLGLLSGAALFDLLYLLFDRAQWASVSYWLIPAGVASGLLAALFGVLDWTKVPGGTRARRVGAFHGIANAVALSLFAASWLMRRAAPEDPAALALTLSFAGFGLASVAGWLGGELVNRLGVGVDDGAHLDAPSSLSSRRAGPVVT